MMNGKVQNERVEIREAQPLLRWYGDHPPKKPNWLIRDLLPEKGTALLAGQFGSGKTFVGADIATAIMLGLDFAGLQACRRGGVLWLAAEGAEEIEARLDGILRSKCLEVGRLPFARQAFDVPSLSDKGALEQLRVLASEAAHVMQQRFSLPLAAIAIDTMSAAAGFDDENSASETQKVMSTLQGLASSAGCLVLAIDHYGKTIETGVRGSSAKAAAADAVLAVLADRDAEGAFSNRRVAVVKLRGGATGKVLPFALRSIDIADGETTCFVEWRQPTGAEAKAKTSPWRGQSRIMKKAIEVVMSDSGKPLRPYGPTGPEVCAVTRDAVRPEFYAAFPSDEAADHKKVLDAKRQAFNRLIKDAVAADLLGTREIEATDWMWFVNKSDETVTMRA